MEKSARKLSSGYRINGAADNAAGLQISEKMRSQIRGLSKASENAQDGISLIQTADGALSEVHSLLQRIMELSVQGGNDTNTMQDRNCIQTEIDDLVSEIDRIASTTEFNTMHLLDGTCAGQNFPNTSPIIRYIVSDDGKETLTKAEIVSIKSLQGENGDGKSVTLQELYEHESEGLTIIYEETENDFTTVQNPSGAGTAGGYNNLKDVLKKEIVPQAVNAIINTYPDTFGYLRTSSIGIGLSLINKSSSSALASVSTGYSYLSDGTVVNDSFSYTLMVNMAYISYDASGNLTASSRRELETTIVHEMTHALMDETHTNGMIGATGGKLDGSNQFSGWFAEGMAQASAGGCTNDNDWVNGALGIRSTSTIEQILQAVRNNALSSGSTTSQYGTGYLVNGGTNSSPASVARGLDILLNEIKNGKSLDDVIKDKTPYSGISDFQNNFGDYDASAVFIKELLTAAGNLGNGGLVTGDYSTADLLPDAPFSTNLFELNVTNTEVTNSYPNGVPKLTDGGMVKGSSGAPGGASGAGGGGGTGGGFGFGTGNGLHLQIGANKGQSVKIYIDSMDSKSLGLINISVSDHINAGRAIKSATNAITKVSIQRSKLGAYQNRLEHAIAGLNNTEENTQAAESRIRDTDIAKEICQYSKEQIISQAAQSVLAQANQMNSNVISLFQ